MVSVISFDFSEASGSVLTMETNTFNEQLKKNNYHLHEISKQYLQ